MNTINPESAGEIWCPQDDTTGGACSSATCCANAGIHYCAAGGAL